MYNKIRYAFGYMICYAMGYINIRRKKWMALLFMFKHCSSDEINDFAKELEKINTKYQCIKAGCDVEAGVDDAYAEELVRLYNNYTGRYGKIFFNI